MNARQRSNLLKLATYLEGLPPSYKHFGMRFFADHRGECELPMAEEAYAAKRPREFLDNCGTVACAVGHGPAAGIRPKPSEFIFYRGELDDFRWNDYCKRAFGVSPFGLEFRFLFSGQWAETDNHHYGAAARIRYFLETGETHSPGRSAKRKYASFRKELTETPNDGSIPSDG